ncbi:MAG: hypothetical protein U0527_06475 [Candidatus Eisenbacteria bacterium]
MKPARLAWFVAAIALLPGSVRGATWIVDGGGGGDFTRIQDAIAAATHGDQVLVHPGHYVERINFGGRRIVVRSTEGADRTTIDADGGGSAVTMAFAEGSATVLQGFTVTGGTGTHISVAAPGNVIELTDQLTRQRAGEPLLLPARPGTSGNDEQSELAFGGGIVLLGASPTLRDLVIRDNTANIGGGLYAWSTLPTLERCALIDNTAGLGAGAAIDPGTTLRASDCRFQGGTSASGGGIWMQFAQVQLSRCWFANNSGGEGGAIYSIGATQTGSIERCVFRGNLAGFGSAIFLRESRISLAQSTLVDNLFEEKDPGAIYLRDQSSATLDHCIVAWNGAANDHCEDSALSANCCDFFPEAPSCASGANNLVLDPRFCSHTEGNFALEPDSPCLPENGPNCGLIGAIGTHCGEPDAEVGSSGKERGRQAP